MYKLRCWAQYMLRLVGYSKTVCEIMHGMNNNVLLYKVYIYVYSFRKQQHRLTFSHLTVQVLTCLEHNHEHVVYC
jgi:hypothetical protein